MDIVFNFPMTFTSDSDYVRNAYTLHELLNCQTAINVQYLRHHPDTIPLYQSGVRYGRTQVWERLPEIYLPNKRKYFNSKYYSPGDLPGARIADCKSLGPLRAAELIVSGRSAICQFRFIPRLDDTGNLDFHILLITDNGYEEDPSRVLGMR
jgi:hypothetical protein